MDDKYLEEINETIKKVDELVSTAESKVKETDELYQSLGIERGAARRFIESDKLTPEQKAKVQEKIAEFQKEVESDIEAMVTQAGASIKKQTKPKVGGKKHFVPV